MTKKRQSNFITNGVSSELLPREQMERAASPHDLKDEAVLAILLKTGAPGCDVLELARRLIRAFGCIQELVGADWRTLLAKIADYNKRHPDEPIKGIGKVKALELAAAFELGYRRLRVRPADLKSLRVGNAAEAYRVFKFIAQEGAAQRPAASDLRTDPYRAWNRQLVRHHAEGCLSRSHPMERALHRRGA